MLWFFYVLWWSYNTKKQKKTKNSLLQAQLLSLPKRALDPGCLRFDTDRLISMVEYHSNGVDRPNGVRVQIYWCLPTERHIGTTYRYQTKYRKIDIKRSFFVLSWNALPFYIVNFKFWVKLKLSAEWLIVWLIFTCIFNGIKIIVWNDHHRKKKWRIWGMCMPVYMDSTVWPSYEMSEIYLGFKGYYNQRNQPRVGHHDTSINTWVDRLGSDPVE
jgi:hypothetical protein